MVSCRIQQQAKVLAVCLLISVCLQMSSGSAIPIWEFLTRNEKMSYLYSTFAQLVSVHCKATASIHPAVPVNYCKRNLLTYGNEKLQTFSSEQLDALDPYQRGANELIWSAIMHEHASATLVTTRKPLSSVPVTSLLILTQTSNNKPTDVKNPIFENADTHKHTYAMDMDLNYDYPSLPFPNSENQDNNQKQQTTTFLSGPLVFRLRPDGSPVEEDQKRPLPDDDDLEHFSQAPIPVSSDQNKNSSRKQHRKIASISALKQQHLTSLARQEPLQESRLRRQYPTNVGVVNPAAMFANYYYGRRQA